MPKQDMSRFKRAKRYYALLNIQITRTSNQDCSAIHLDCKERKSCVSAASLARGYALVEGTAKHSEHTNSWKFTLRDAVWSWPDMEEATEKLRAVRF